MSKRTKTVIKVAVVLSVFSALIIGIFVFLNNLSNTFAYQYELLDDGTYVIQGAEAEKYGKKIVLPDTYNGKPISAIKSGAFESNSKIEEIVIPKSVKVIESGAFRGCENLIKINLGSVEEIGIEAFADCIGLQEIILPDSVKQIGENAFSGCSELREISIPIGVTKIGDSAFANCTKLESLIFNAAECEDLEASANLFAGCSESGLRVEIGKDVKRIPANLLAYTYKTWDRAKETVYRQMYEHYCRVAGAQGVYFGNSNVTVMSFETWVLSKYSYNVYQSLNVTEIVFAPESQCKELGENAFRSTMIKSIVFPKSLTVIEARAVGDCEMLEKITFENPKNWQVIGTESNNIDFSDKTNNALLLSKEYANFKIQRAE